MALQFVKATKHQIKARIAIDGPAGAGKTYTALIAANVLADGGKIAVIDTERGSASLYSDKFDFDVVELNKFDPRLYIEAINLAESLGYSVIVIDSLSHAWEGEGGVLELHEQATKRQRVENSYTAWRDVTPIHRKLVDTMLQSKCHVIATMRSKMEYEQGKDSNGKAYVKKIGLAPVQRAGTEYEFTIVADMDVDHNIVVSKSRCDFMADLVCTKPDVKFFEPLRDWLKSGVPESPKVENSPEPPKTVETPDGSLETGTDTLTSDPEAKIEMIEWFGGKSKPSKDLIDIPTINNIMDRFVGKDKVISAPAHLKNHLRTHFKLDRLQDMSWEKAKALITHCRGEGDDQRWYAEKPAQLPLPEPPAEPAKSAVIEDSVTATATTSGDGAIETFGVDLDKVAFASFVVAKFDDLDATQKEKIVSALNFVKTGVITADNTKQLAELVKLG